MNYARDAIICLVGGMAIVFFLFQVNTIIGLLRRIADNG